MDDVSKRINQLARSQVDMVKSVLGKRFTFEDNESNETNGGYTTYGTLKTPTAIVVVRISNHICSMDNKLLRRMGKNLQDPYKERCFYSIVFKAFNYQPNDNGKWKATCKEYVFNPLEVEKNGTIGRIAQDCTKLNPSQVISIRSIDKKLGWE